MSYQQSQELSFEDVIHSILNHAGIRHLVEVDPENGNVWLRAYPVTGQDYTLINALLKKLGEGSGSSQPFPSGQRQETDGSQRISFNTLAPYTKRYFEAFAQEHQIPLSKWPQQQANQPIQNPTEPMQARQQQPAPYQQQSSAYSHSASLPPASTAYQDRHPSQQQSSAYSAYTASSHTSAQGTHGGAQPQGPQQPQQQGRSDYASAAASYGIPSSAQTTRAPTTQAARAPTTPTSSSQQQQIPAQNTDGQFKQNKQQLQQQKQQQTPAQPTIEKNTQMLQKFHIKYLMKQGSVMGNRNCLLPYPERVILTPDRKDPSKTNYAVVFGSSVEAQKVSAALLKIGIHSQQHRNQGKTAQASEDGTSYAIFLTEADCKKMNQHLEQIDKNQTNIMKSPEYKALLKKEKEIKGRMGDSGQDTEKNQAKLDVIDKIKDAVETGLMSPKWLKNFMRENESIMAVNTGSGRKESTSKGLLVALEKVVEKMEPEAPKQDTHTQFQAH